MNYSAFGRLGLDSLSRPFLFCEFLGKRVRVAIGMLVTRPEAVTRTRTVTDNGAAGIFISVGVSGPIDRPCYRLYRGPRIVVGLPPV